MIHIHTENIGRHLEEQNWEYAEHLPSCCQFQILAAAANVETSVGTVPARAGDVILRDEHGIWVLTREMFDRVYIRVSRTSGPALQ